MSKLFVISPTINAKTDHVAMCLGSGMHISKGELELTPVATQWQLEVTININSRPAFFDVTENLLRSFLAASFCVETNVQAYEQVENGFVVTLVTSGMEKFGEGSSLRRGVENIKVTMDFAYPHSQQPESIFPELVALADYGFTGVTQSFSDVAPLLFQKHPRERLAAIFPLFKSINMALELGTRDSRVEALAEQGLLNSQPPLPGKRGRAKAQTTTEQAAWSSAGSFYAVKIFQHRRFIVITDYGEDLHEPAFFSSLEP